jgi:predicted PurR-regulated permease PerM
LNPANELAIKRWQMPALILVLISAALMLWLLRNILLPFMIGFFLAYLILPVIRWVEKRLPGAGKMPKLQQLKRISLILAVYLLSLGVIGLAAFYVGTIIIKALSTLSRDAYQVVPNGLATAKHWIKAIPLFSPPSIQQYIDVYAAKAGVALPETLNDFLSRGIRVFRPSAGMLLGFFSMPFFVFFLLKDWCRLRDGFYGALPSWSLSRAISIVAILRNVVGRYFRGQLLLGLAVGLLAYVMLMILKIDFAVPLAVFAGITEMVPMIGPWLGGGLGVLVTLATAPEKAIWVALGYLAIQLFENNLLYPRIQGSQMMIHPAFVIVLGVLGVSLGGILGAIVVLPITMAAIKIIEYLRNTTGDEKPGILQPAAGSPVAGSD